VLTSGLLARIWILMARRFGPTLGSGTAAAPLLCILHGIATLMIRTVSGWAAAGSRIVLGITLLGHENLQIGYKPNEHAPEWFLSDTLGDIEFEGAWESPVGA
jgi:hypothetical protein